MSDLVVASQSVDARLNENQAELGIGILAILLQMAADVHGLSEHRVSKREMASTEAVLHGNTLLLVACSCRMLCMHYSHLLDEVVQILGQLRSKTSDLHTE
jgi:hypothetical protein